MSREIQVVARPIKDPCIPDALCSAVLLLQRLEAQGLLAKFEGAFRMGRRGGHTGKGICAFLLALLMSSAHVGIRPFAETYRASLKRVARLVGLMRLPSAASISRALGRLEAEDVAFFNDAMLTGVPGFNDTLRSPDMLHLDGQGCGWHILDIDPTVKAFRQRHLDSDDERPAARRLAPGCSGYTGHKRGELRIRSVPVAHAGLGCWLAYRMWPGNPHVSVALGELVDQALAVMAGADVDSHDVIFRMDGEFGSAGCMRAIQERGAQVITRLSRYGLLRRSQIAQVLGAAEWEQVVGDRQKEAADLGVLTLYPSVGSLDVGGKPARVRVVTCRRLATDKEHHGTVIDGHVYELFATTLTPDGWSAASIVQLYSGRASIENRFAQEDREFALGRTFSYNPHGQEFATGIGLFLWNYQTILGITDTPLVPSSIPTPAKSDWLELPSPSTPPTEDSTPIDEGPETALETGMSSSSSTSDETVIESTSPDSPAPFPFADADDLKAIGSILERAYGNLISRDWTLVADLGSLRCPNEKLAYPFSVVSPGNGRPKAQVIVRPEWSACNGCPIRSRCFQSNRADVPKQVARAISAEDAATMRRFLSANPSNRKPKRLRTTPRPSSSTAKPPSLTLYSPIDSPDQAPGPLRLPTFVPGDHRRAGRQLLNLAVSVEIQLSRHKPDTSGHRRSKAPSNPQHSRHTWSVRRQRWAAPHPHLVKIHSRRGQSDTISRLILKL